MSPRRARPDGPAMAAALAGPMVLLGGCLATKVVTVPAKLAATTVVVAGETAGAVVTTTGKVASSGVRALGQVGGSGLEAAARFAQAGTVTFVDAASAGVVRVPWRPGLTLAGASHAAQLDLAQRTLAVVRAGRVIHPAGPATDPSPILASGDVVRLGP